MPYATPKDAAIALAWRPGRQGPEVLWMRRGAALRFGGGFYAFPGGKLEASDGGAPVAGASGEDAALRACAVRECFEETGILLARGAEKLTEERRAALRARLQKGEATLAQILSEEGLTLAVQDLVEVGRWVTPEFFPVRFDARMFLVRAPEGQDVGQGPLVGGNEASEVAFVAPLEAVARWRTGEALLHPPTLNALRALARVWSEGWDAAVGALRVPAAEQRRIEFQPGMVLVPQVTQTLPPATHTSAFLLGVKDVVVIDPGSDDEGELATLLGAIEALGAEGRRPAAVALTHHHIDHVAGAGKLQARLGLPLWAHASSAEGLRAAGLGIDRTLADGEDLRLSGFPLTALHTPGHTRGHLAFFHPPTHALIAGDLVSTVSTIVVDPPDGNMADYIASLRRLVDLGIGALYPAHGAAVADGPGKLKEYIAHRLERERLVFEAVGAGAGTAAEVVPRAYVGTPESLFPLAERSAQAHLDKLVQDGRVAFRDGRYVAVR